jgi:hypothetical protein
MALSHTVMQTAWGYHCRIAISVLANFLILRLLLLYHLQQDLQDVLGENASILSEEEADMARTLLKLGQGHLLVSLLRAWTHNAHLQLACSSNIVPTHIAVLVLMQYSQNAWVRISSLYVAAVRLSTSSGYRRRCTRACVGYLRSDVAACVHAS